MEKELVSVIMPVYNAEKYIEIALHSLMAQTYQTFEVILVNDGSTDKSSTLISELIDQDKRFKVLTITNHGQGYARHLGIQSATGEYLTFMDSDDIVAPQWLEVMVTAMQRHHVEMVCVNYAEFLADINLAYHQNFVPQTLTMAQTELYTEWCLDKRFKGFLWNKLFRTESILAHNEIATFTYMEDSLLILELLDKVQSAYFDNQVVYYYRFNPAGTIRSTFKPNDLLAIETFEKLATKIVSNNPQFEALFAVRLIKIQLFLLMRMSYQQLKENRQLLTKFGKLIKLNANSLPLVLNRLDLWLVKCMRGTMFSFIMLKIRGILIWIQRISRQICGKFQKSV
ncbi:glycosyltransferase family 2 protein [Lactiplantibacillus sp. WILCCON 0030]|uniref:Glycosyltransferase family 2 protein n=1 Tax=Lactiplantibacillus brownii TaxID=3069269 RepID=A0ABU1ABF4_9LACO|nr:glycosyltransferase family 2 protein [Lactiplantibacillus brownii]MDQ7937713.1 glycosyltransferase family 2 protein [Lactiplantibacillus brownii]